MWNVFCIEINVYFCLPAVRPSVQPWDLPRRVKATAASRSGTGRSTVPTRCSVAPEVPPVSAVALHELQVLLTAQVQPSRLLAPGPLHVEQQLVSNLSL